MDYSMFQHRSLTEGTSDPNPAVASLFKDCHLCGIIIPTDQHCDPKLQLAATCLDTTFVFQEDTILKIMPHKTWNLKKLHG